MIELFEIVHTDVLPLDVICRFATRSLMLLYNKACARFIRPSQGDEKRRSAPDGENTVIESAHFTLLLSFD